MYQRHTNRLLYFKEQNSTTERYIIPYLTRSPDPFPPLTVAEIGCGYGGNLKPFLDRGCKVVGIDINPDSIKTAESFFATHPHRINLQLLCSDIYQIPCGELPSFDLILLKDTIEHIHNQELFFKHILSYLKPDGTIFISFPPWRMPFGGHQQMCVNPFLSKLPYFHILPKFLYRWMLQLFGEDTPKIHSLLEIKETRLSIQKFQKIVKKQNYTITKQTFYLINPNYEVKFGINPRTLPRWLNIPVIRDFFTTAYYVILTR